MTPAPLLPSDLQNQLAALGRYGLQEEVKLAPYTSFNIGGPARWLLTVQNLSDLIAALHLLSSHRYPFFLLGGGSNLLISDAGIPGLVILNHCKRILWPETETPEPAVTAESGAALAGFARAAIRHNLSGLAWAVSIPGTIGGAVVGNAGAHGSSIADHLQDAILWHQGRIQRFTPAQLQLSYRRSVLKNQVNRPALAPVVLSATFRLQRGDISQEKALAEHYITHRRRTQPLDKSAGSIFKNPPGDYAGRLIEAAGLKGYRLGDAAISTRHANFIVNLGQATAADVLSLMNHIRHTIDQRFGIILQPEIQLAGDWSATPSLAALPSPSSSPTPS